MPYQMTDVIMTRPMTRTRIDGVKTQVEIRFGKPALRVLEDSDGATEYYCPIQLVGFQDDTIYATFGVDEVNAVVLAFMLAPTLLRYSLIGNDLDFARDPNYGFPILVLPPPGPEDPNATEVSGTEG